MMDAHDTLLAVDGPSGRAYAGRPLDLTASRQRANLRVARQVLGPSGVSLPDSPGNDVTRLGDRPGSALTRLGQQAMTTPLRGPMRHWIAITFASLAAAACSSAPTGAEPLASTTEAQEFCPIGTKPVCTSPNVCKCVAVPPPPVCSFDVPTPPSDP